MKTTPKLGRTFRLCTAVLCMVGLSACPNDDDGPVTDAGTQNGGSGNSAGTGGQSTAGTGGNPAAGNGGASAGKGGASAGTGGKPAAGSGGSSAGNGGTGTSDEDAGVVDGKLCGTRGAGQCEASEFCNFEPDKDCGATDRGGSCEAKPDICTADFTPVCGCDDKTYSNACNAHAAGVSVKAQGECGGTGGGATCGGIASLECAGANEFCNYEAGQGCDGTISDAAGKCEAQPSACTKEYKPVCSCDRKSHGNKCEANSMGASVLHEGVCTVSDCEYIGGRVAVGTGPAAMCDSDEVEHTYLINDNGSMAIEGMLCCLKK
jgi:hypothetical protein